MAMTPEAKVKKAVKSWLDARKIWHCSPIGSQFGSAGVPDVLACMPPHGRFIGIEVKAPGKRSHTTDLQKRQLAGIESAGGTSVVVDDVQQLEMLWPTLTLNS